VKAGDRVDELRGDADGVRRASHAAFEYCAHVQLARNRADVVILAFERKGRRAGRHLQLVDLGQ
jgi:hypothetical protein